MKVLIAVVVVLAIVQLYTSGNLDKTLDSYGYGVYKWIKTPSTIDLSGGRTPGQMVDPNPSWPSPAEIVKSETAVKSDKTEAGQSDSFALLYSEENLKGTRTRAENGDAYIFCEQRGGNKKWNFKSIEANPGQAVCLFSRWPGSSDSASRFIIVKRPIRSLSAFLDLYPEITTGNTGIHLYGWEHQDKDFIIMPVTESMYQTLVRSRLQACHDLTDAWKYDTKARDDYCQFNDPVS